MKTCPYCHIQKLNTEFQDLGFYKHLTPDGLSALCISCIDKREKKQNLKSGIVRWIVVFITVGLLVAYWYSIEYGTHNPTPEQEQGYNSCIEQGGNAAACFKWYYED